MTASGLSGSPTRCTELPFRPLGSRHVRVMAFSVAGRHKQGIAFRQVERSSFSSPVLKCNRRQVQLVKSAMDASYGDMANDSAELEYDKNGVIPYLLGRLGGLTVGD